MVFNGYVVQQQFCKKEEECRYDDIYDEIDSDEEPPEELLYDHLEDEANLVSLKNYCNAEDEEAGAKERERKWEQKRQANSTTNDDMTDVEREIKEMMESIKNLHTTLSQDARVGDMFKVEATGEQERGKGTTEEENIKASVEEMEKMDAILRVKAAEERKAKLCRIQLEEESRDILSKLTCTRSSNVIKENLEEFIRLLNDLGGTESDSSTSQTVSRVDGAVDKEKNKDNDGRGEKKTENKNGEERKAKHFKFVEKNIQLAKCGRGTLSLTDEEKQRIEELLQESGGHQTQNVEGAIAKDLYAIDDETKSVLTKIDQQLEAVMKASSVEPSGSKMSLLEKRIKDSEKEGGGEENKKKKENRLAEINKLLNAVTSVTLEEVTPLSEEEIENLLEQSRRSLDEGKDEKPPTEGAHWASRSEDVISELVANAKLLMPKFKYRFVDS